MTQSPVIFKSFLIEHMEGDWYLLQSDPQLIPYPGMVIDLPDGISLEIYNSITEGKVSRIQATYHQNKK